MTAPALSGDRFCLADPTGQIERECSSPEFKQKDVALTYAMAIRDEDLVPVDWHRANAAIRNRWPKGFDRVKQKAWRMLKWLPVDRIGASDNHSNASRDTKKG